MSPGADHADHEPNQRAEQSAFPSRTSTHIRNATTDGSTEALGSRPLLSHRPALASPESGSGTQLHTVRSTSPKTSAIKARSNITASVHTHPTNQHDHQRAQLVLVTNSANFTRQELRTKLDELRDLLPAGASDDAAVSSNHSTAKTSFGRGSQSIDALTPIQTQTLVQAQRILDKHVATLSRYNEIKDIAMEMLGILAEQKGMTMKEMMAEKGVDEAD